MTKSKRSTLKRGKSGPLLAQPRNPLYIWLIIGGVGLVVLVAVLFYLGYQGQAIANSGIEGLVIFPDPGRGHADGEISYDQVAPVGGIHNSTWLHCGIYAEPVRRENVIHSMEHGAVWLAYQPELPADQVETLRGIVRGERSSRGEALIVLAPMPGLDAPIVATAWRVQLKLEDAFDERLQLFLNRYQRGPFTPEPGANCTFGGIGEPLPF
jgi:hypothetical protein